MNSYFMAAFTILMLIISGCASSLIHQNTTSKMTVERNPANEVQITNRQNVYLVMAQVLKSIKAGKARQSCYAADLSALNSMGIYIKSLSVMKFADEIMVYPVFNEKGDASKTELGYGMCFVGPLSEWGNILK